jgi:GNAT superfamily N-acetyltransferase
MKIREITIEDSVNLYDFLIKLDGVPMKFTLRAIEYMINSHSFFGYLSELDDGTITAATTCQMTSQVFDIDNKCCAIYGVAASSRYSGHAVYLLKKIVTVAKERGASNILIGIDHDIKHSPEKLYAKLGFKPKQTMYCMEVR